MRVPVTFSCPTYPTVDVINRRTASQDVLLDAHFNARSLRKNVDSIFNLTNLSDTHFTFLGVSENLVRPYRSATF